MRKISVFIFLAIALFTLQLFIQPQPVLAKSAEDLILTAFELKEIGQTSAASLAYRQAKDKVLQQLVDNPNDPNANYVSGLIAYYVSENQIRSIAYEKFCDIGSRFPSARNKIYEFLQNRAQLARKKGRISTALELEKTSYQFNSEKGKKAAADYFDKGKSYLQNCQLSEASSNFKTAIDIDEQYREKSINELKNSASCQKKIIEKMAILSAVITLDPSATKNVTTQAGKLLKDGKIPAAFVPMFIKFFPKDIQMEILKVAYS